MYSTFGCFPNASYKHKVYLMSKCLKFLSDTEIGVKALASYKVRVSEIKVPGQVDRARLSKHVLQQKTCNGTIKVANTIKVSSLQKMSGLSELTSHKKLKHVSDLTRDLQYQICESNTYTHTLLDSYVRQCLL